jgi:hypothetical protein
MLMRLNDTTAPQNNILKSSIFLAKTLPANA